MTTAVDDLPTALRHAVRCLDAEGIVVVVDSILNQKLMSRREIDDALSDAPGVVVRAIEQCDARSQSGTETYARIRLRARRIQVEPQVFIAGIGYVDLLAGRCLIIELDSREFHTGADRYAEDRRRDRIAIELGYITMRLTYRDVIHEWPRTLASIQQLIRTRRHHGPR